MAERKVKCKLVIRRLPPTLPEDIFRSTLKPWEPFISWFSYFPGKAAKSAAKEDLHSRAYIVIHNVDVLLDFCRKYDGHGFKNAQGEKFFAQVELAPFQRFIPPTKQRRPDARINTIEDDPTYKAFLESLNSEEKEVEEVDKNDVEYIFSHPNEQPQTTPLLESLKKKQMRKQRYDGMRSNQSASNMSMSQNSKSNPDKKKKRRRKNKKKGEGNSQSQSRDQNSTR